MMEAEVIESEGTDLMVEVRGILGVATSDQYLRVSTWRGLIKTMADEITVATQPAIDSAKAHYELLRKERDDKVNPLRFEYKRLGGFLGDFDTEQKANKRRKELEIEAANKLAAEKERAELSKIAKDMGEKSLAKEILKTPLDIPPVVVVSQTPSSKDTGVSFREDWVCFECTDLKKVPIEYHMLNEVAVRKVVRALKGATNIPGIKVLPPNKISVQR